MQQDWRQFLQSRGTTITAGATPGAQPCIADLSAYGLLSATGEERMAFLQSQLSNDIHQLLDARHQLTAYANAKGRLLAVLRAFSIDDRVQLLLPESLRETVQQRLQMYVLRARVRFDSDNPTLARLGVFGAGADALLTELGVATPGAGDFVTADGHTVLCMDDAARFLVVTDYQRAQRLWTAFEQQGHTAPDAAWRCLDIEAGLASVYPQTLEAFTPQMLNLDLVGGISFDKGCFPGQEVIARTHYLGKAKRRSRLGYVASPVALQPGAPLFDAEGQPLGQLVDAAIGADDRYRVLMVLPLDRDATVYVDADANVPVDAGVLPYPTDAEVA